MWRIRTSLSGQPTPENEGGNYVATPTLLYEAILFSLDIFASLTTSHLNACHTETLRVDFGVAFVVSCFCAFSCQPCVLRSESRSGNCQIQEVTLSETIRHALLERPPHTSRKKGTPNKLVRDHRRMDVTKSLTTLRPMGLRLRHGMPCVQSLFAAQRTPTQEQHGEGKKWNRQSHRAHFREARRPARAGDSVQSEGQVRRLNIVLLEEAATTT